MKKVNMFAKVKPQHPEFSNKIIKKIVPTDAPKEEPKNKRKTNGI